MSVRFLILATVLITIIPALVSVGAFFVALPWWTELVLSRHLSTYVGKLQFVVSDEYIGWATSSDRVNFQHSPYSLALYVALASLAVTLIETASFASASAVPFLWCLSGIFGSAILFFAALTVAWLAQTPLRRIIDRALQQYVNERFAFATEPMLEIQEIAQQIDSAYASMGLPTRTNILELGRAAVLEDASLEPASVMAELIAIKQKSEHDLRHVRCVANLFAKVHKKLERVEGNFGSVVLRGSIEKIDKLYYLQDFASALKDARWQNAYKLLQQLDTRVDRLLETSKDAAMPASVRDAYRVLNVSEEISLQSIKAVVSAYRRVWHPDLARDEVNSSLFKLRMQQINVAWDIIQKARERA
jgi:hypothetical protein